MAFTQNKKAAAGSLANDILLSAAVKESTEKVNRTSTEIRVHISKPKIKNADISTIAGFD